MADRWTRLERAALVLGLIAFAVAFSMRRLGDFDLHWHLASGRQIAALRAIPRIDDLTYTHPRIRYTEFLSDLGLYAIVRAAGPAGLQALGGVVALAIGVVLLARARGTGPLAPITAAFALLTLTSWILVRPATMSFLFFGLAILLIENHRRGVGRPWQLGLLVPLQLVWCNVHQSATLGVALVVGYFAYRVVARLAGGRWPRFVPEQDGNQLRFVALAALAATAATGANTAGFQYLTGARFAAPMHELATEWMHVSLSFAVVHEPFWLVLVACALLALAFGFGPDGRRASPELFDIGLALPAIGLSYYERFIPLTAVALAPIIAHRLAPAFRRLPLSRAVGAALPLIIAPLTLLRFQNEVGSGLYEAHFPRAAVEFVRGAKPAGPMWNFSPFGGYIEWELYPTYRAFLDGRVLDMDIAQEARRGEFESAPFNDLANRFGITWAICRAAPDEGFCLPLASNADWTMVFWDDVSAIYVKRDGPNSAFATRGYRAFRHTLSFENTLRRAVAGSAAELDAISRDGNLAFVQAPQSARAAFLAACGAIAARDAERFARSGSAFAGIAPQHPAIPLLKAAWAAAVGRAGNE